MELFRFTRKTKKNVFEILNLTSLRKYDLYKHIYIYMLTNNVMCVMLKRSMY